MDLIRRDGLTAMQSGRLDAALSKRFRFDDGIRTLGENLARMHAAGELVDRQACDGSMDWNRRKFNAMGSAREQAAYEARLKARRYYFVNDRNGIGHAIPKIAFDAIALPLSARSI